VSEHRSAAGASWGGDRDERSREEGRPAVSIDPFSEFDAAYVLGALSEDDRLAYEQHLMTCDACAAGVESLHPLPALLASVPNVEELDDIGAPPATLLPHVLREVRRTQRRRRWYASGIAAAVAACLVLVTVLIANRDRGSGGQPIAMQPVVATHIHATADVRDVAWGTRIQLECRYDSNASYPPDAAYSLVAYDRSGQPHPLGTWRLVSTGVTTFASGTALHRSDLDRIAIQVGSGTPLLVLKL
jgi:hypothetical protein